MELDEKDNPKQFSNEEKLLNRLMFVAAGVLAIIFLSMTTCTMHSNTYDPQRLKEEAVSLQSEYAMQTAISKHKLETIKLAEQAKIEKIKTMERMIKDGANPVAAACAVHGWNNDDIACIVAAGKDAPKNITE